MADYTTEEIERVYEQNVKPRFVTADNVMNLKSEQLDALTSILNHRDTLAVLPTGHGKSLIYILAVLLMDWVSQVSH